MSHLKLVFHVNENDRWPFTIRSVDNFLLHSGVDGSNVTVVANGAAVRSFSQLDVEPHRMSRIHGLVDKGVNFLVCNTGLELHQIKKRWFQIFARSCLLGSWKSHACKQKVTAT